MIRLYSVFWIPCSAHGELKFEDRELPEVQITGDNVVEHSVKVRLYAATKDEWHIEIDSKNLSTSETASLVLHFVEGSRNGLLVFSYESPGEDSTEELRFIGGNLNFGIYHQIKNLFHEHRFHTQEAYIFKAYSSRCRPNIRKIDSAVLKHYFEAYRDRFRSFSSKLNSFYSLICDASSREHRWQRYRKFNEDCQQIFGEEIFYRTLLSSQYNISCKTSLPTLTGRKFDFDLHRLALETENLLSEIHLLHLKSQFQTYQEIAGLSFEHQQVIKDNIRQIESYQQQLIEAQNDINNSLSSLADAQTEVSRHLDSLRKAQSKTDRLSKGSYRIGWIGLAAGVVGVGLALIPNFFPTRLEKKVDDLVNVQHDQSLQIRRLDNTVYLDRFILIDSMLHQTSEIRFLLRKQMFDLRRLQKMVMEKQSVTNVSAD